MADTIPTKATTYGLNVSFYRHQDNTYAADPDGVDPVLCSKTRNHPTWGVGGTNYDSANGAYEEYVWQQYPMIALYGQYTYIRVLDFMEATNTDRRRTWADRVTWADRARWDRSSGARYGLPIEALIYLANQCGSQLSWPFPQQSNTDYMYRAGIMFARLYNLSVLWFEGPNEIWNGSRGKWYQDNELNTQTGGWTADHFGNDYDTLWRRHAQDFKRKQAAFMNGFNSVDRSALGLPACTVKRIISGQTTNSGVLFGSGGALNHLDYPADYDGYYVACYFGDSQSFPQVYTGSSHSGTSDRTITALNNYQNGNYNINSKPQDSGDIPHGFYEGGQHIIWGTDPLSEVDSAGAYQEWTDLVVNVAKVHADANSMPLFIYSGAGNRYNGNGQATFPIYDGDDGDFAPHNDVVSNLSLPTAATVSYDADTDAPVLQTGTPPAITTNGTKLLITFNEPVANSTGFTMTVNGGSNSLSNPSVSSNTITFDVTGTIYQDDTVLLTYSPGNVTDTADTPNDLAAFSDEPVDTTLAAVNVAPASSPFPVGPGDYTAPTAQGTNPDPDTSSGTDFISNGHRWVKAGETFMATGSSIDSSTYLKVWAGDSGTDYQPDTVDGTNTNKLVWETPADLWEGVTVIWPYDDDPSTTGNAAPPWRINAPHSVRCDTYEFYESGGEQFFRIYGENLKVDGYTPVVVLEPTGGGTKYELTIDNEEINELIVRLPANLPVDDYDVWVHNGTGGELGWGEKTTLKVAANPGAVTDIVPTPLSTLQDNLSNAPSTGRILQFGPGTFTLTTRPSIPTDRPIIFEGAGKETYDPATGTWSSTGGTVLKIDLATGQDATLAALIMRGYGSGFKNMSIEYVGHADSPTSAYLINISGKHSVIENCAIVNSYSDDTAIAIGLGESSTISGGASAYTELDITIRDCDIYSYMTCINHHFRHSYFLVYDCNFYVMYDGAQEDTEGNAVADQGANHAVYRDNVFRSVDRDSDKVMNRAFLLTDSRTQFWTIKDNYMLGVGPYTIAGGGSFAVNQGECIICHFQESEAESHGVTSATASTVVLDAGPTAIAGSSADQLTEFVAFVAKGPGVGQWRNITALATTTNADDTLTVSPNWRVNPTSSSVVQVMRAFQHMLIINNWIDPSDNGTYADDDAYQTVGVVMYKGVFDSMVYRNRMFNTSAGIQIRASDPNQAVAGGGGSSDYAGPVVGVECRDNSMFDIYDWTNGAGGQADAALQITTHGNSQGQCDGIQNWMACLNTFRGGSIDTVEDTYAIQIGWRRKTTAAALNFQDAAEKGMFLNLFEGFSVRGVDSLLTHSAPANWTYIKNITSDDWTNGVPTANEQLDSNNDTFPVFGNSIEDPTHLPPPLEESSYAKALKQYVRDSMGAIHHFRLNETGSALVDHIGGLAIGVTSGVTQGEPSLVGFDDPSAASVKGSATVVTTRSRAMTALGATVEGPWSFSVRVKLDGTPDSSQSFLAIGDDGGTRSGGYLWYQYHATTPVLNMAVAGVGNRALITDASGLHDGAAHTLTIRYDHNGSNKFELSLDGGAFSDNGQAAISFDGTPTILSINVLQTIYASYDADESWVQEVLAFNRLLTDADAADLHNRLSSSEPFELGENVTGPNVPHASDTSVPSDSAANPSDWTNPSNVYIEDAAYATATGNAPTVSNSYFLEVTDFDFDIPEDHEIVGVEFKIKKFCTTTNNCADFHVQLIKGGTITGADLAKPGTLWPSSAYIGSATYITHGGPTELWGTTLSPSDINASTFGVAIAVQFGSGGNTTAQVDHVEAVVYHRGGSDPGDPGTPTIIQNVSVRGRLRITGRFSVR